MGTLPWTYCVWIHLWDSFGLARFRYVCKRSIQPLWTTQRFARHQYIWDTHLFGGDPRLLPDINKVDLRFLPLFLLAPWSNIQPHKRDNSFCFNPFRFPPQSIVFCFPAEVRGRVERKRFVVCKTSKQLLTKGWLYWKGTERAFVAVGGHVESGQTLAVRSMLWDRVAGEGGRKQVPA